MQQMKDIEGIVVFANAYTAVVLRGTHDEDGFYPEGLIDVHFPLSLVGNKRLNPGDWISTKLTVKKEASEKNPDEYFDEMLEYKEEYIEPDDERWDRFKFWIEQGKKMREEIEKGLKLSCFGELDYSDKEWRENARTKKYPCQILSGCAVSEECSREHHSKLKIQGE